LKREFLTTGDGSITIHLPEWDEQYHSKHGAITEAKHVFIAMGMQHILSSKRLQTLNILEVGFGTGLNAFLSLLKSRSLQQPICYTGVESFPVLSSEIEKLNYPKLLNTSGNDFNKLHEVDWEKNVNITSFFQLHKQKKDFREIEAKNQYDLIYFDAFGPRVQPELWTETIFQKMFNALKFPGVLVTYSAKGDVRRIMQAVGFKVERLPGPPGKREMLRGTKHSV